MATGDVRELWRFRSVSVRDGIPGGQRAFYVEGQIPDVALVNVGIPRLGDADPVFPGTVAQNIDSKSEGAGSVVTVSYTPPEYVGGSVPTVNQFADGFIGKDVSFENELIEIPLFQRQAITTTDASGLPISLLVYGPVEDTLPIRKRTAYYRVPVSIDLIGTTLADVFLLTAPMIEQTDKIHKIFGRDLAFAPEGMDQQTADRFVVTYRWYADDGVPNTLADKFIDVPGRPDLKMLGSVIYPVFSTEYIIPPFHGVRIHGAQDPSDLPVVEFFEIFERNNNGWTGLPGVM